MKKLKGHFGDWLPNPAGGLLRVIPVGKLAMEITFDIAPSIVLKPEGIDTAPSETQECRQKNQG